MTRLDHRQAHGAGRHLDDELDVRLGCTTPRWPRCDGRAIRGTGSRAVRLGAREDMYRRADVLASLDHQYESDPTRRGASPDGAGAVAPPPDEETGLVAPNAMPR